MRSSKKKQHRRGVREYALLGLRGFVMGCADVVPGVSGGTMAFILGIYEELVNSIRAVTRPEFLNALSRFQWKKIPQIINWKFLLAVGGGILLAVLTMAHAMEWLLVNQPVMTWSFFFGLVAASVFVVSQRVKKWTAANAVALIAGAAGAYFLVGMVPAQTPNAWWFLILSGALAICAMILPGISGAFILVLLGKYQHVLNAVTQRDFMTIAFVGAGAVIGLLSFTHVLGWLFKKHHDITIAVLTGLMIGSLRKVWPWKSGLASLTETLNQQMSVPERNILPPLTVNGAFNAEILIALAAALAGAAAVISVEIMARRLEGKVKK